jgi:pectin methylesterase-like acyl-CoA thioesterase
VKKIVKLFWLINALVLTILPSMYAQGKTYWTEGFEETVWPTSSSSTSVSASTGVWQVSGTYRTTAKYHTGSACLYTGGSGYFITPLVTGGVKEISFYSMSSGSARTLTIYKSTDGTTFTQVGTTTSGTSSGWSAGSYTISDSTVKAIKVSSSGGTTYFDDIALVSMVAPAMMVAPTSLSLGTLIVGNTSASAAYTFSGSSLTGNVTAVAPASFKISKDNISFYDSLTFTPAADSSIVATTVYVQFLPASSVGTISGSVVHSGGSANSVSVSVTGVSIAVEPTQQSTLSFGLIAGTSMVVNFTGGNGTQRLVVVRADSTVTFVPADGVLYSGVSSVFSSATNQGNGNRIVYTGSDTTVTVTGLASGTKYYVAVYEYNVGSNNSQNYLTVSPATGTQTTLTVPALSVTSSSLPFGYVLLDSTSAEKSYSISGNYLTPESGSAVITAPTGFEVSTTSGSGFTTSTSLSYTGSTLSATTIYVRFKPTAAVTYSGMITNVGGGADTLSVAVSGIGVTQLPDDGTYDIIVASDGSGDYKTVQEAFNAIPSNNTSRKTIFIKNGTYYEKDSLVATKDMVTIVGQSRDSTILTYDDYTGKSSAVPSTYATYSVAINSNQVKMKHLTIKNTATAAQAVALRIDGDQFEMLECNLVGWQDTYYVRGKGRAYHKNCYIEGATDFIFGWSVAVFDSCTVYMKKKSSTVICPSTSPGFKFGIVMMNCTITASSDATSFYLGRAWKDSPRGVYYKCYEPSNIYAVGWMEDSAGSATIADSYFAEYGCTGAGYVTSGRLSGTHQLTDAEAAAYTIPNIFSTATASSSSYPFSVDWIPTYYVSTPTSVARTTAAVPNTLCLEQNYPNPFNPTTQLDYTVAKAGFVSLKVYDVLGREIAQLVGSIQSAGQYSVQFDASNLGSGVYFAMIRAGGQQNIVKMLLVK